MWTSALVSGDASVSGHGCPHSFHIEVWPKTGKCSRRGNEAYKLFISLINNISSCIIYIFPF